MKQYTQNEINDLAGSTLDIACAFIQEQMNIKTGDLAGLYFSGNRKGFSQEVETFKDRLREYIKTEFIMNEKQ